MANSGMFLNKSEKLNIPCNIPNSAVVVVLYFKLLNASRGSENCKSAK